MTQDTYTLRWRKIQWKTVDGSELAVVDSLPPCTAYTLNPSDPSPFLCTASKAAFGSKIPAPSITDIDATDTKSVEQHPIFLDSQWYFTVLGGPPKFWEIVIVLKWENHENRMDTDPDPPKANRPIPNRRTPPSRKVATVKNKGAPNGLFFDLKDKALADEFFQEKLPGFTKMFEKNREKFKGMLERIPSDWDPEDIEAYGALIAHAIPHDRPWTLKRSPQVVQFVQRFVNEMFLDEETTIDFKGYHIAYAGVKAKRLRYHWNLYKKKEGANIILTEIIALCH